MERAKEPLRTIDRIYSDEYLVKWGKFRDVAIKMVTGERLDYLEEQFILTKLEK